MRNVFYIKDICIPSCIAPILNDIFLASKDNLLKRSLQETNVIQVFRFVDLLVILDCDEQEWSKQLSSVLSYNYALSPLILTHELPVENVLRFLDVEIHLSPRLPCWAHKPRVCKPTLPLESSYVKVTKRSIVQTCLTNAFNKSREHLLQSSSHYQICRLREAGYPHHVISSVMKKTLKKLKKLEDTHHLQTRSPRMKYAVIPYIHAVSNSLKKVGARAGVEVFFLPPSISE